MDPLTPLPNRARAAKNEYPVMPSPIKGKCLVFTNKMGNMRKTESHVPEQVIKKH